MNATARKTRGGSVTSYHVYFGATGFPASGALMLLSLGCSWLVPTPVALNRNARRHTPAWIPREDQLGCLCDSRERTHRWARPQAGNKPGSAPASLFEVCVLPLPLPFCRDSPGDPPRVPTVRTSNLGVAWAREPGAPGGSLRRASPCALSPGPLGPRLLPWQVWRGVGMPAFPQTPRKGASLGSSM